MREKVMLTGEPNTSKSLSLVFLAVLYPNSRVVVFDPDDGMTKLLHELGIVGLPNLSIVKVDRHWDKMIETYQAWKTVLKEDDWLCLDMLGRFWDLAQSFYSYTVFGVSPIQHLLALQRETSKVGFGGFDGLSDWIVIKRLHNELLLDDAVLNSPFNVMATTASGTFSPKEKLPKIGAMGVYAKEFGLKPEGEKHNVFRFDTQAVLFRRENRFYFRLVRDRGRTTDTNQEFDITSTNFWSVYAAHRGIQL